ncbi:CBS domain-containing protein [Pseudarthrobacter scleromae]|uniref:CBS domain-containing protein n=1 Tax=Pseudarthrobacter scleromae TaxID=158897 RepID=A0ABQ2CFW2_9MICC|nr:CBS domain-containing protein [Pseudarthrobacter scleromae]GGI86691.1 CBS domain-containing protein [Pseudarthrobacter scleromae]
MTGQIPPEPDAGSDLNETKKYLDYLKNSGRPIEIRTLIGYWGNKGRGKVSVATITSDLARMGLRTDPPFDSGPLDSHVTLQGLNGELSPGADDQPEDHLLTLSRIPSASFALRTRDDESDNSGFVRRDSSVADAVTVMLRNDFSQLPVIESEARREIVGVFTWESYAQARLRGDNPILVGSATIPASAVDLHSDLFASVSPIADHGYVLVTYRGQLSGIVTASDLTREFEKLTLPFLAVGRCEQELKRVARVKLSDALAKSKKNSVEELMFGELQQLFKNHWTALGWSLSLTKFDGWLNTTRKLRNSIAHFDNQDQDLSADLEVVHRLTRWLRMIAHEPDQKADDDTAEPIGQTTTAKQ